MDRRNHSGLHFPYPDADPSQALLLLLERHTPGVSIKEEFQQLISSSSRRKEKAEMAIIDLALILYLACDRGKQPLQRSIP
jgi:hypothetical protein